MDNEELARILLGASSQYKGSVFGTSLMDQYNNARVGQDRLNYIYNNVVDENGVNADQYNRWNSILGSQKMQAGVGMGLAGLQGLTSIAGVASGMAKIGDTTKYQNQIDNISRIGTTNYGNFDQIATDYGILSNAPSTFDYDTIRGGSTKERIGGLASSALSGASAGLTIGGPLGALIGGGIGLIGGAIGWKAGDSKAAFEKERLENESKIAQKNAIKQLGSASNDVMNYQFRSGISNRVAMGGKIERKEQTLKEFADRVLGAKKQNSVTHSSGIVRRHCTGGTMIRIKR